MPGGSGDAGDAGSSGNRASPRYPARSAFRPAYTGRPDACRPTADSTQPRPPVRRRPGPNACLPRALHRRTTTRRSPAHRPPMRPPAVAPEYRIRIAGMPDRRPPRHRHTSPRPSTPPRPPRRAGISPRHGPRPCGIPPVLDLAVHAVAIPVRAPHGRQLSRQFGVRPAHTAPCSCGVRSATPALPGRPRAVPVRRISSLPFAAPATPPIHPPPSPLRPMPRATPPAAR